MISNDPKIAAIHADIERNVKRMLADACRAELRCQPPTTHGVVKAALDRVQKEFSDLISPVDL